MDKHKQNSMNATEAKPRLTGFCLSLVLVFWGVKPIFSGASVRPGLLIGAGILALLATASPQRLLPLAKVMHTLAGWLTRGVSWIALLLAFWGVITPAALVMKLFGRDLLKLRFNKQTESYWSASKLRPATLEELRRQF